MKVTAASSPSRDKRGGTAGALTSSADAELDFLSRVGGRVALTARVARLCESGRVIPGVVSDQHHCCGGVAGAWWCIDDRNVVGRRLSMVEVKDAMAPVLPHYPLAQSGGGDDALACGGTSPFEIVKRMLLGLMWSGDMPASESRWM